MPSSGHGDNNGKKRPATLAAGDGNNNNNNNNNNMDKQRGNDVNPKRQKTNRRRRPIDPSSLPRFLDSTGAVTAGTFAARRLPEMKSLWRSFLSTKHAKSDAVTFNAGSVGPITGVAAPIADDAALYRSGGRKTSDRHLRRRTGSHSRRRRHRYPTRDVLPQLEGASTGDVVMTNDKKPNEQDKKPCRRARRKRGTLREAHRHWQVTSPVEKSTLSLLEQEDPSESPTIPSKWLETHLWHTKRFHMGDLFGWKVPLAHTGRGTAAALRLAQTNCTVQDATWSIDGGAVVLCAPSMETLCVTLAKICGEQAETLQDKMVLSGMRWGEGTVHQHGAYPLGVIGPARFLFYRQEKNGNSGNADEYHVAIFVHPAIRGKLYEALSSVTGADDCECNLDHVVGGLSLIQVRGTNTMNAIRFALRPTSEKDTSNVMSWDQVGQSSQAHTILPHGTVMPVKFSPTLSTTSTPQTCENVDVAKANQIKENTIIHIEQVNGKELLDIVPSISGIGSNKFAVLISHRPNNGASQGCHNTASSGWDILCSPAMAKEIFLCLNNKGSACAIGLAEEASTALEAEPPIALFPRDFPDTETGEAYWSGHNSEWNIVRCCFETGAQGGRCKTELKRTLKTQILNTYTGGVSYQPIDWSSITDCKNKTDDEADSDDNAGIVSNEVEVVRGTFGAPFAQALAGSGRFTAKDQGASSRKSEGKERRPRRRVRPSNVVVNAEPLEDEEADAHENMCQMLLSSLSLPALLRCHISVEGKGNLMAGATIFEYKKEAATQKNNPDTCTKLGYVVAGAFSSNRGQCHGPAFVGAAKLLQSLIENEHVNTASVTSQGEVNRSVALRVLVRNAADGSATRSATLQLML